MLRPRRRRRRNATSSERAAASTIPTGLTSSCTAEDKASSYRCSTNVLTTIPGQDLAMYPLAAACLVLLIKRRTGGRDRGSLLDALSVTTALALLSWIFFIDPYVQDPALTWQERATSIGRAG